MTTQRDGLRCDPYIPSVVFWEWFFFGLCYIVGAAIVGENNGFCLGYWKLNPDHQVYGKSLITAWGYIHGAIWFGMAICGFLANMFAGSDKPGFCCKYSWAILFWVFFVFYIGWWMTGNYWVFTNAIIPQLCKDGKLGNATLHTLYFSVLIIEDAIIGLMVLAALIVGPCALFSEVNSEGAKPGAQGRARA
uniref:Uncharacterized protein n=1 Tax=Cryptomonas curvata TaxID=233186 RepID=A0A7S0QLW3_9CRYP